MPANSNKEIQIKGDKKLIDLTSSGKFLISKFDDLEKERKEKHKLINTLQISSLKVAVKNFEKQPDVHEQYLHRNYLLIHGLNETKTEERDKMVLDIKMSQTSIDRSRM